MQKASGKGSSGGKGGSAGSTNTGGSRAMAGGAGNGGGASNGGIAGGTAGTAGASATCDLTAEIVGTCELPQSSGVGSCVEYHGGSIDTTAVVEQVCANNPGASFTSGSCPSTSFEDLDRLGCCVTAGSFTRSCYYGAPGTSTTSLESVCQAFGCAFEPE